MLWLLVLLALLLPGYQVPTRQNIAAEIHDGEHSTVSISADGRYIARYPTGVITAEASSLEIWDRYTLERVYHAPENVLSFSWSPVANQFVLVSLSAERHLPTIVYDLAQQTIILELEGGTFHEWHSSGWLVTRQPTGEDWFWSAAEFETVYSVVPPTGYSEMIISPDGQYVAYRGEQTVVYAIATGDMLHELDAVDDLVFSADGRHFVTRRQNDLQVYATPSGETLARTSVELLAGCGRPAEMVWYADNERLLVTAGYSSVWDFQTGAITTLDGAGVLSPDQRWLAVSKGGTLTVYDADTFEQAYTLTDRQAQLVWSPDSRWLVSYGYDGLAHVYDMADGTHAAELAHYSHFGACATILFPPVWSPAGDYLVTYEFSSPTVFRVGSQGQVRVQPLEHADALAGLPLFTTPDDIEAEPLAYLLAGTKATVLSIDSAYGWYEVQTGAGLQGWVYEARINTAFQLVRQPPSKRLTVWPAPQ